MKSWGKPRKSDLIQDLIFKFLKQLESLKKDIHKSDKASVFQGKSYNKKYLT